MKVKHPVQFSPIFISADAASTVVDQARSNCTICHAALQSFGPRMLLSPDETRNASWGGGGESSRTCLSRKHALLLLFCLTILKLISKPFWKVRPEMKAGRMDRWEREARGRMVRWWAAPTNLKGLSLISFISESITVRRSCEGNTKQEVWKWKKIYKKQMSKTK